MGCGRNWIWSDYGESGMGCCRGRWRRLGEEGQGRLGIQGSRGLVSVSIFMSSRVAKALFFLPRT
jgi:hypothetical protein